jgi:hypothetical protein
MPAEADPPPKHPSARITDRPLPSIGQQDFREQKWRERCRIVQVFTLFVIVDASGMIAADPLAPTMQPEQLARLMAGEVGVADKLQMSFEAGICQGVGQATHARDKIVSLGLCVEPSEGEQVERQGHRHLDLFSYAHRQDEGHPLPRRDILPQAP